ncbi:unnamed protein product [Tuber melanosporum]|uniref:(Perigord truffle) hypothetical protein n=1 Tax=Tuber melanosporum (strain Mel28) TaxID=656061 RepID=D5G889_TUBMM|nr:uncharacterized protein GSTUM_00002932001 [Tuber melanosporum]CAZ80732.1 unnamed protein product [Tuber melanosporum]
MERREVYRNYHEFLSLLLLPDGHPNKPRSQDLRQSTPKKGGTISVVPHNEPVGGTGVKAGTREQLRNELETIGRVYEEHLLRGLTFPGAAEYHEVIGEWVDRVMENWRVSGGSGEDASAVVETLYKASTKSFHSPRILRHLFTALTATGNFPDTLLALNTYLEFIHRAKERISKGHVEKDFDDDKTILQTVVEGIRVVCAFIGDGEKAMTMAETLEKWIDEWYTRDPEVLSDVYRGIGMANATWARQTVDAEERPDAQLAAIEAFKKGLSYDTLDVDGWYGLALVQVEHGDIESAVESSKRGLTCLKCLAADDEADELWYGRGSYRRRAIPLLHLLAILMTIEEDFEGAERACENAFEILGDNMAVFRDMGVGEKEGVLEVKMTQIAIEEALNGPGAAVKTADSLLDLYGRLFEVTNVVGADLPTSTFQNEQVGSVPSTRPNTASRKSRLLGGRSHKKEFAASATNLSQDKSSFQQSGSDGSSSLTKRPKSSHQSLHQLAGTTPNPSAPKIQVTEHSSTQSASTLKKQNRPKSVSGGTIRRMKSFGSFHSSGHSAKQVPEVPTPPLPSSTEASSVSAERSPAGSVKGPGHNHHPHLFHMLKMKLKRHQLQEMGSSDSSVVAVGKFTGSSTSFVPDGVRTPVDGAADAVLDRSGLPRADDIPHNLERGKIPHPIRAIGGRITDEIRGKGAEPRNIKRPVSLPEPRLKEEDERKRAAGALRAVWIFVGGLYRRAGHLQDAAMAVEEAASLVGTKGDGEADMLTQASLSFPFSLANH